MCESSVSVPLHALNPVFEFQIVDDPATRAYVYIKPYARDMRMKEHCGTPTFDLL